MRRTFALSNTFAGAVPLVVAVLWLAACGGGSPSGPAASLVITGTVTGLEGSGLVRQNNGASDLEVPGGSPGFVFTDIREGSSYRVTIKSQPATPTQACTISNGSGVARDAVYNLAVACTTTPFVVRGSITGLTGTGMTVLLNGGGAQPVAAGATTVAFPPVPSGTRYAVTLGAQPSGQALEFGEQVTRMAGAESVAGPFGANLANGIFPAQASNALIIATKAQPEFSRMFSALGVPHAHACAEPVKLKDAATFSESFGFRVALDDVDKCLEALGVS